jgi:hypothetical protein
MEALGDRNHRFASGGDDRLDWGGTRRNEGNRSCQTDAAISHLMALDAVGANESTRYGTA